MSDERVWLLDKSGLYTMKSGYAITKLNVEGRQDGFNWKQGVWNVKCSPTLQHFLWKLKKEALAVGESLTKRGIPVDGKCKRCGAMESVIHVMLQCPFAQRVWEQAPAMFVLTQISCP